MNHVGLAIAEFLIEFPASIMANVLQGARIEFVADVRECR
jgi:hypothetical protein